MLSHSVEGTYDYIWKSGAGTPECYNFSCNATSKEDERMSNRFSDIQRILSTEDDEFRQWLEEHHSCESRLVEFAAKDQVTLDQELEEKTLKKRKLHLKDQMADRIRTYESQHAVA